MQRHKSYLNVGYAEAGDGADLRTRNTRRLKGKHGLEVGLQICYGGRHDDCLQRGLATKRIRSTRVLTNFCLSRSRARSLLLAFLVRWAPARGALDGDAT